MPEYGWANPETALKAGKVYLYVIVIFATAFIGAWLGSLGDMLLLSIKMELPGGWAVRHWLWIGGAVLAAIGYPLGWITINGYAFSFSKKDHNKKQETETTSTSEPQEFGAPAKVLPSAAMFGFFGAFLGLFLGGSLLLIWFSLSMSPWPPEGWLESLSAESADLSAPRGSRGREGGLTTRHPIAMYCFLGPIVVLGTLGVFIGGVGAACGWVKDVPTKKRSA